MEILINSIVDVGAVLLCYVLGYKRGQNRNKLHDYVPSGKCQCNHKANVHHWNNIKNQWEGCTVFGGVEDGVKLSCACTKYVESFELI